MPKLIIQDTDISYRENSDRVFLHLISNEEGIVWIATIANDMHSSVQYVSSWGKVIKSQGLFELLEQFNNGTSPLELLDRGGLVM